MGNIPLLLLCIALCQGAGLVGGWATAVSLREWYPLLRKPWFTPPNWLFPVAWTTLFLLMGIALYLVWRQGSDAPGVAPALAVFGIHLILNMLWSIFFFSLRSPGLAFGELILFWLSIVATIVAFAPLSTAAAWLLAPYLVWATFAGLLNWSIWRLNPGGLPAGEAGT
jgi:translocator protein